MNYKLLNNDQRKRMRRIINNEIEMKWEEPDFFNTLMGKLPSVHHIQNENEIQTELTTLERMLSQYDFFLEDKEIFIKNIENIVASIQHKKANWYGLSIYEVEESIRRQECCLISGEGGIGKSYFIKCLEEEFELRNIPHLCIYGKFEKNTNNIEVNEIVKDSQNGFVFIVDAINEMSENGQENLLNILHILRKYKNIRIILTYRTNAIDASMLEQYKEIAKAEYIFPGVSFESALGELLKLSIPDIYKYEDILYSNNALLLSMLCSVLSDKKIIDETENGIATITFILEHYIKKSIKRIFKGKISDEHPIKIWKDTKEVAKWMYENERKEIDEDNLRFIVKTGETFIWIMMQVGFLREYDYNEIHYFSFAIDSLTDFLIARSLFEDIAKRAFEKQVEIISKKVGSLYSIAEALIIAIFDNYAPDYQYIIKLLKATNLLSYAEIVDTESGERKALYDPWDKAKIFFKEIIDNKHWLIDDEEIAQNMKKAEKYDSLLEKYKIKSERDLENILKIYSQENEEIIDDEEIEISKDLMIQYGISSIEEFINAQQFKVFRENFVHVSESDKDKFEYVKNILERAKNTIFNYLATLEEYDVSDPVEVTNTIFIIKKYGKEMVLITRPSDYGQVILYYGAEKDTLDFEKDYELWVEDGIEKPQQITFGKMLKLTGINRIPLRKVR